MMQLVRLRSVWKTGFVLCVGGILLAYLSLAGGANSSEPAKDWKAVRILDLNAMPWTSPPGRPAGWKFKNIHTIESTGGGAEMVFIPPNWSTKTPRHYDKESGWYFFLSGETAVIYYQNPQDQTGTVERPRAGYIFYGVEGAIHSFDERTIVPEGTILLSWHDKRPRIEPVPFDSKETTFRGGPWLYPKVFDTREVDWEEAAEGYLVRSLYAVNDAKVEMRYYPPGWKPTGAKEYADYDRWIYVLDGSLNLHVYEWPGDAHGKVMRAGKGQVIEIPAHSIFGGGDTLEAAGVGAWVLAWREQGGKIATLE